ncbi:MAG: TauD/TfdA dioxygenase family protein [Novosphingobium sp.]
MPLQSKDLTPLTGSELHLDPADILSGAYAQDIRDLLEKRGVLVFRNAFLEDDELVRFADSIGTLNEEDGEKGLFKVTLEQQENMNAYILYGTRAWHMDRLDTELPPRGTILAPRVIAEEGGDTEFANTYAAWADLSDEDKALIDQLWAVHYTKGTFRVVEVEDGVDVTSMDVYHVGGRKQPLVWHHRNGRNSLVLGWTAMQIEGMDDDEADKLIRRLLVHAEQAKFVYRHKWRMGDVVVWDNTGTMHRVLPYAKDSGRMMHRVTLMGEEPLAA